MQKQNASNLKTLFFVLEDAYLQICVDLLTMEHTSKVLRIDSH